jgi:EAL domain-containing protein (putative c-di-GMP-specific phosphodiesterase class I)
MLELGRTLKLKTLAEGIETEEQLDQLRQQHCDFGQGYLFARPMTADKAEELLTSLAANPLLPLNPGLDTSDGTRVG